MAFPRLPALAELGWSPAATHDWNAFRVRLAAKAPLWTVLGINFYHSPRYPDQLIAQRLGEQLGCGVGGEVRLALEYHALGFR
jgi:N-acetyl-beta-hexosaminidase